jgi:hypothetical protein
MAYCAKNLYMAQNIDFIMVCNFNLETFLSVLYLIKYKANYFIHLQWVIFTLGRWLCKFKIISSSNKWFCGCAVLQ